MSAKRIAQSILLFSVTAPLLCLFNGCNESASSDFRPYSEVEPSDGPVDTDTKTGNLPNESDRKSDQNTPSADISAEKTNSAVTESTSGNGNQTGPVDAEKPPFENVIASANAPNRNTVNSVAQQTGSPNETTSANGNNNGSPTTIESSKPREVKILVPTKQFKVEGPENAIRVSYDDLDLLKVLNMEPVTPNAPELMPKWLQDLDGKRIRIRGFMYPSFLESGITLFALARDNQICCFGRNPKIYDLFEVGMRKGKTTNYIQNRPFDVVGIFRIRPEVEEGKLYRLYLIEDAVVLDK